MSKRQVKLDRELINEWSVFKLKNPSIKSMNDIAKMSWVTYQNIMKRKR